MEFNAHRVFAPLTIVNCAKKYDLDLKEFHFIDSEGLKNSKNWIEDMSRLSEQNYGLGIFLFKG